MIGVFKKFSDTFGGILKGKTLDKESLETLEALLYTADFGTETVEKIIEEIQSELKKNPEYKTDASVSIAKAVVESQLIGSEGELKFPFIQKPKVILLIGVNGAGKTTTSAKLAHRIQNCGGSVLLSACDTFRAAANEQIKSWAEKLNVDLISSQTGADSAAVAYDSLEAARKRDRDLLIIDTAGRLHTKKNLMNELEKLERVLKKQDADTDIENWLVIDGSLGSNSIDQALAFNEVIPLHGLILTKMDGSSRGGSLVGIYNRLKIPIYFIGTGEGLEDLQPFCIENYTQALFMTL
ncbi:MAG: signal recognition particle-docking protein FtsY [Puniceicoccaceae bacterium]|nr:signal recognition particle-docking protein FtsY [Puniceicoccaceae bacterium]